MSHRKYFLLSVPFRISLTKCEPDSIMEDFIVLTESKVKTPDHVSGMLASM